MEHFAVPVRRCLELDTRRSQAIVEQHFPRHCVRVNLQILSAATHRAVQVRPRRTPLFLGIRDRHRCVLSSQKVAANEILLDRNPSLFQGHIHIAAKRLSAFRMAHLQRTRAVEREWVSRQWHACIRRAQLRICRRVRYAAGEERQNVLERPAIVANKVCPHLVGASGSSVVEHAVECCARETGVSQSRLSRSPWSVGL
jgi:hypothetical protein